MIMSALLCTFIPLGLLVIYTFTQYSTGLSESEKLGAFECGFDPLSKMRSPFSSRFFLLTVLFLIFDVEAALLFPILSLATAGLSLSALWSVSIFLLILLAGLYCEWYEGALDWANT
uniref:NADH-ubiquinone oxidoreductase chain 3 n=1 Tax=Myosotella myosotis TaxID=252580 RepID=G8HMW1_9EUPU|nr:NADH dehydrogenase subunit 3 [Myosotella myosotis]